MSQSRAIGRLPVAVIGVLAAFLALTVAGCEGGPADQLSATPVAAQLTAAPVEPTSPGIAPTKSPTPTEAAPELEANATPVAEIAEATETSNVSAATTATATATSTMAVSQVSEVTLAPVAGGFALPTYLTHAFDERLFVVEQAGRIKIVAEGETLPQPFLGISSLVGSTGLEQGLLSVAFHPDYHQNGRFFVNYTDLRGDTVLAEYQVDAADPDLADPGSERILLTVDQPYGNHNGGQLQFGPDGYLYVGMGDGGSAGDPQLQGQDPGTLLGALLRLDVDSDDPDSGLSYGIPADNPFVGVEGARDEVWAYGLRNPWRFSFDRQTGDLYIADVGQNLWEEVNFQAAGAGGGDNYGWNVMEASTCFGSEGCDSSALALPAAEYQHQDGNCSIIGGYVYRGSEYPALNGNYFYADYCSGIIWSLFDGAAGWQSVQLPSSGIFVSTLGEGWDGELYIIDRINGEVYQLRP